MDLIFLVLESERYRHSIFYEIIYNSDLLERIKNSSEKTKRRFVECFLKEKNKIKYEIAENMPDVIINSLFSQIKQQKLKIFHSNNNNFNLEYLYRAFKKEKNPTTENINTFYDCIMSNISNLSYSDIIESNYIRKSFKYLSRIDKNLIDNVYKGIKPPQQYAFLILRQAYGSPINEIIDLVDANKFIKYIVKLGFQYKLSNAILQIIEILIDYISNNSLFVKTIKTLASYADADYEYVENIFKNTAKRHVIISI